MKRKQPSTIHCLKQINKRLGWFLLLTLTLIPCIILRTQSEANLQVQAQEEVINAEVPSPSPTPTSTPSPTPTLAPVVEKSNPDRSEKEEIIAYIVEVFGEEAPNAFNVLYCENRGLRADAVNWNSNGSWDAGIFQINSIHGYTMDQMKDYKQNIKAAKKIFDGRGWNAWACSERVDVTPFWKE